MRTRRRRRLRRDRSDPGYLFRSGGVGIPAPSMAWAPRPLYSSLANDGRVIIVRGAGGANPEECYFDRATATVRLVDGRSIAEYESDTGGTARFADAYDQVDEGGAAGTEIGSINYSDTIDPSAAINGRPAFAFVGDYFEGRFTNAKTALEGSAPRTVSFVVDITNLAAGDCFFWAGTTVSYWGIQRNGTMLRITLPGASRDWTANLADGLQACITITQGADSSESTRAWMNGVELSVAATTSGTPGAVGQEIFYGCRIHFGFSQIQGRYGDLIVWQGTELTPDQVLYVQKNQMSWNGIS